MLRFVRMLLCVLFEFCSKVLVLVLIPNSPTSTSSKYSILSLTDNDALCFVRMLLCLYLSIADTILIISLFLGVLVDVLVFRSISSSISSGMFAL